jgi:hypothetical protein
MRIEDNLRHIFVGKSIHLDIGAVVLVGEEVQSIYIVLYIQKVIILKRMYCFFVWPNVE